jgi:hypothetical protein
MCCCTALHQYCDANIETLVGTYVYHVTVYTTRQPACAYGPQPCATPSRSTSQRAGSAPPERPWGSVMDDTGCMQGQRVPWGCCPSTKTVQNPQQ